MWIIKYPNTSFARAEFTTALATGDTTYEDCIEAESVASNMRCTAANPYSSKCSFCGGPKPCTRDD